MNGEDMERRLHWLKLARELGQEDDFRALLDDVRRDALMRVLLDDERQVLEALPTAPYAVDLEACTDLHSRSLYPVLTTLERKGLVVSEWDDMPPPRRRRYRLS